MGEWEIASDGLRARENGEWAKRKLEFLDQFGPPALDATEKKRRRVYIDLFAGPGLNLAHTTGGGEFESGALRMLTMRGSGEARPAFTDAYLVNLDRDDQQALTERVDRLDHATRLALPRGAIRLLEGDANQLIPSILSACNRMDYLFVFADPENPSQWPWRSVEALVAGGHESMDLYLLLPLEMGIRRLLNFKGGPHQADRLTEFFGTDAWEPIVGERVTPAQSQRLIQALEDLYLRRLGRYWSHVNEVLSVHRVGNQGLYRMIFASNHDAGLNIARWAKRKAEGGDQGNLFG